MSIVNRRNAVLGWLVWRSGKFVVKTKAKKAVPSVDRETKRPNKSAVALAAAGAVGAAAIARKRFGSDSSDSDDGSE